MFSLAKTQNPWERKEWCWKKQGIPCKRKAARKSTKARKRRSRDGESLLSWLLVLEKTRNFGKGVVALNLVFLCSLSSALASCGGASGELFMFKPDTRDGTLLHHQRLQSPAPSQPSLEEKMYTTTAERSSFGKLFWPKRNFPGRW